MHDMENQIAIANRRASEAENKVCATAVQFDKLESQNSVLQTVQ